MLMKMIEVFVLKFRTISKHTLPLLFTRCKQSQDSSTSSNTPSTNAGVSTKTEPPQTPAVRMLLFATRFSCFERAEIMFAEQMLFFFENEELRAFLKYRR